MKIEYHYETAFKLPDPGKHTDWIIDVVTEKGHRIEALNFIFCDDNYLLDINRRFLDHDYLTDIITFPTEGISDLGGDIFISVERVRENAGLFEVNAEEEMRRVMIHGVLHLMGYSDASKEEKQAMRLEEDAMMNLFHVKHR